jgi:uncharacterized hydantoinase/oxoprolinase family protein
MRKIIIDDGSNYIKIAYKNDSGDVAVSSFPSRVIRKALPSTAFGFSDSSYQIEEQRFSVAKTANDTIPTDNRAYQLSTHNRVLLNHALKTIGVSNESVSIAVTLPVGQFFNPDGSKNEELINKKIANAKGDIKHLDGSKNVEINTCYVLPEAVPAFVYAKYELELTGSRYLIVDVGGTTTDLVVINSENQIEEFQSLNIGALKMLSQFKTMTSEQLQLSSFSDEIAIQGVLTGLVAGEDVSLIAKKVLKEFETNVNECVERMGYVYMMG